LPKAENAIRTQQILDAAFQSYYSGREIKYMIEIVPQTHGQAARLYELELTARIIFRK